MKNAVVVSSCNADYFHYLQEQLHSFEACGAARKYDFAVLDAGLTAPQLDWLRRFGVQSIVKPGWPIAGLEGQPEWYKACLCRPFFPDYFGAWNVIVYTDSDNWFQNCDVLDAAVAGAEQDGFAAVPYVDRSHWPLRVETNSLFSVQWHRDCLRDYYGPEIAERFQLHPILAGSLFAGRRDAPHWMAWRQLMVEGLRRKIHFNVDQASMTLAVHQTGLPTHFLPIYHHWIAHMGPVGLDTRSATYVEPYLPHLPISSLCLAAHTKTAPVLVRTTDGRLLNRLLRYGRQHERHDTHVTLGGAAHAVDGVATPRFREQAFAALSATAAVRFVQIGAMDGVTFDPLHDALRRYGWSGIFVEPMPDPMARLRQHHADMPGLRFAQMAIAAKPGSRTMQRVSPQAIADGLLPAWAAGLSSLTPVRNALGGKGLTPEQYAAVAAAAETIEVDCLDFAGFEDEYEVSGFDVLQISAAGYDWQILEQIDLGRHAPKCVHIEIECLPPAEIDAAVARLRSADYVCYALEDGRHLLALRQDFGAEHFGIV